MILCISHLAIASDLGLAKASFELAKIYQDEKYLLPSENGQSKNTSSRNKAMATSYALTAERQANNRDEPDGETLLNLARWHEASSFSIGKNRDAERCEKAATQLGFFREEEENCMVQ